MSKGPEARPVKIPTKNKNFLELKYSFQRIMFYELRITTQLNTSKFTVKLLQKI